jgi:hypothetical protein
MADQPGLEYEGFGLDDDGFPTPVDRDREERQVARIQRLSEGLADPERFHEDSAPHLLGYEIEAVGHYLRHGRFDRIAKLLATVRPRHIPLLWHAVRRLRRSA